MNLSFRTTLRPGSVLSTGAPGFAQPVSGSAFSLISGLFPPLFHRGLSGVLQRPRAGWVVALLGLTLGGAAPNAAHAQLPSPFSEKAEFTRYAEKLRESVLQSLEPEVRVPSNGSGVSQLGGTSTYYPPAYSTVGRYPWKTNIVTTIFWVGESATVNNPVHNRSSSWDLNWKDSFGGFDNPDPLKRRGFIPAAFTPRLNPFYVALPYNDMKGGTHKPEARAVIPWFKAAYVRDNQSVCRDRWVAIRNVQGRVCYAQWNDCGPFRTDHWQYVFGKERPAPNLNQGAGLDVSPAVRDYLKLNSIDVTDWKFVEVSEIPRGPWGEYGENNDLVLQARRARDRMATVPNDAPRVIVR